jgi:predicted DCC family thiol-disulfide oxidoreductase YuxK
MAALYGRSRTAASFGSMCVDSPDATSEPLTPSVTGAGEIWVVYDGMCPFCASYVRLCRMRELAQRVHLIDARSDHPMVEEVKTRGLSLENGLAVKWNGHYYHGAEALAMMAMFGSESGLLSRLNRFMFSRPKLGGFLYPAMVAARRLTLKLLGRPPIMN